ncbi:telomerase reverse transcriptase-like isoform X2 [Bacillus rossius redtenbacheri]|uniref:telomerase reverse transcriptase-like isoform X2 n=1 Tax=Bacillus rossius redtenbacheri TaxID=93214 RepID=UPI002FDCDB88
MNVLKHFGSVESLPEFLKSRRLISINNNEVLDHFQATLVSFKEPLNLSQKRGSKELCWSRICAVLKTLVPPELMHMSMWERLCWEVVDVSVMYLLVTLACVYIPAGSGSYVAINIEVANAMLKAARCRSSSTAQLNTTTECLYELISSSERSQESGESSAPTSQVTSVLNTACSVTSDVSCVSVTAQADSSPASEERAPGSSLNPTSNNPTRARHKRKKKKSEKKTKRQQQLKSTKKTRRSKRKKPLQTVQVIDDRKAYDSSLQISTYTMYYNLALNEKWPHSHVLCTADDAEKVLASVLATSVGVQLGSLPQREHLQKLSRLLQTLMARHRRLSHEQLFKHHARTRHIPGSRPFSSSEVYLFTSDVVRRVVPLDVFGSGRNRRVFLAAVRRLTLLGLHHTMTLGMLMCGMRTSRVKWLNTTVGHAMCQHILAKVMLWLFDYVILLLKCFFYVTEPSSGYCMPAFYWKRHWRDLQRAALADGKFQEVSEAKANIIAAGGNPLGSSFGIGRIRFIPKEKLLRPIQTLRDVSPGTKSAAAKARLLLRQVNQQRGFGPSASLHGRLHAAWRELRVASSGPGLHLVRTDIRDAYGAIDHRKLVGILLQLRRDLLEREPMLLFRTYKAVKLLPGRNNLQVKQHYLFEGLPGVFPANCLLIYSERKSVPGPELFSVLLAYVERQVVKSCRRWYWVTQGLPHGGTLSPALCDLYYGTLESRHLRGMCGPNDRLLRAVDDYLFVTDSRARAQQFASLMMAGFPTYNCRANVQKTQASVALEGVPASSTLNFCGMEIVAGSLEVRGSYDRMRGRDVAYCLQLGCKSHPGSFLENSLRLVLSLKLDRVFLDEVYNSPTTVLQTVYKAALMSAFRLHAIVRCKFLKAGTANRRFFTRIVACTAAKLARLVARNSSPPLSGRSTLSFHVVRWLTFRAYHVKLSRHGGRYKGVVHDVRYLLRRTARELDESMLQRLREVTQDKLPDPFHTMK